MRNLISIINTQHSIAIVGNTFDKNTVVKGVIYIDT